MKNIQWNSINKKQNELEQSKNEKSSTLPQEKQIKIRNEYIFNLIKLVFIIYIYI